MNKFEELKAKVAALEEDAVKFYEKGNATAGTRLRAGLQEIKGIAQDGRNEVTAIKNNQ